MSSLVSVEVAAHSCKTDDIKGYSSSPFPKLDDRFGHSWAINLYFSFDSLHHPSSFVPEDGIQFLGIA
jgi:hypothetical protein